MTLHIKDHRDGFAHGMTWITGVDDAHTGIGVGVWKLSAAESAQFTADGEIAWLLMNGDAQITLAGQSYAVARTSLFDQAAACVHAPAGAEINVQCKTDTEFTCYQVANERQFPARFISADEVECENRGKDQVGGACFRIVRTIFGVGQPDGNAELVLGEVVNLPGRWSSYPPHHHAQPEIYHYRFDHPQGYGHAELGDDVLKVRHNDSVKITDLNDHSQCAAPGYSMYYSWVIRHLPDAPYVAPQFTREHQWVMRPDAECWRPKEK